MRIGITERGDGGLEIERVLRQLEAGTVDGAIIVTKAPQLLLPYKLPSNTVIHCTITGLSGTALEPGVSDKGTTRAAFLQLLEAYGGERVVLRVDPILPWNPCLILGREIIRDAGVWGVPRVRVSFLDFYPHVQRRFADARIDFPEAPLYSLGDIHAALDTRVAILSQFTDILGFQPEVCGEPGLHCTGCVSLRDLTAMGLLTGGLSGNSSHQRGACACLAEKTELLGERPKGGCQNGCVYCYWA